MTKIVVDPYYPPRNVEDKTRENLFELVYSELPENACNKRRPFNLDLVYPLAELKQQIGTVKPRNTASNPAISNRVIYPYLFNKPDVASIATVQASAIKPLEVTVSSCTSIDI